MHHKIVALDAWNVLIPPNLLQLPGPHTYELISHTTQLTSAEDIQNAVRDATIVATTITPIQGTALDVNNTPNLQLIVAIAAGTDCIDTDRAAARGIKVVNCPNANTETVANHVLAMYFAGRRHLIRAHNTMLRTDEWPKKYSLTFALNDPEGRPPMTCRDETVGIVGYGAIGRRVAELCRALGMNVLVAARKGSAPASPDRAPFSQVLARSTVLVLCVPRGPDTLGLISAPELQAMPRHALLLNGDSPLLRVDAAEADVLNLVVTPHVAWCSTTTFYNYLQAFKRHVEDWCGRDVGVVESQ
ncbi:glycerate dehydrogenase [Cordyceps fumosorosea ARSEF 2679]|uniref:Glycerate dehydrogenase n=1 Tax=Cordyceps fumosorosea (strain ARSEF 2679) TaxID=1081104 RepID=A0A168E2V9_CORFA|nr:glycerate dehydrogenase [Cordyceps fumosorosea ARSEF 2679]OAA73311.1 glycerate dehydrogenase [Cordyceps fumosorosea ARSEF 2679]